ncbi:MAG: radical SAM protein [Clostridia bacterium]|nr:radical SAM protein [Clostridia bacterium]
MYLVVPVFVPHAGCPHDCCFCNQKVISGSRKIPGTDEISGIIAKYETEAKRYPVTQIAFFGGSFTAIEPEVQEHYLKAAAPFLKKNGGFADAIRISTRPDAIDEETVSRLKKYSVKVVELGAQSMDDKVLALSERGHTAEDTVRASKLLCENGFVLGLQTMTGLPGADRKSDIITAERIADLGPDFVRIYPTIVVKNTKLCRDYMAGTYKPMSVDEAVSLCSELCRIYVSRGIEIARIGLQSTDSIARSGEESEVAGGPYHEAFGQLVRSYDVLEAVSDAIKPVEKELENPGTLTLVTDSKYFSDVLGQGKTNAEAFKERFGFSNVKVAAYGQSVSEIYRKRAGQIVSVRDVNVKEQSSQKRLANISECSLIKRREMTGRDTSREFTDVVLKVDIVFFG